MESQKRVELVEALISWRLVDELMRYEGIDDGEFKVDYSVNFKPTQTLTKVYCPVDSVSFVSHLFSSVGGPTGGLARGLTKCIQKSREHARKGGPSSPYRHRFVR